MRRPLTGGAAARLHIEAAPGVVGRYRFGRGATNFRLCADCATHIAAAVADDEGLQGVVNVGGANLSGVDGRTPEPTVYDEETAEERLARRLARRTAVLTETQPNA